MSPGTYLRLRRLAAGLTLDTAARMSLLRGDSATPGALACRREALVELEAGRTAAPSFALSQSIARAFRFDRQVLEALTERALDPASELPLPLICTGCGCSWNDPCNDPVNGPCAWRDGAIAPALLRCCYCPPAGDPPAGDPSVARPGAAA